MAASKIINRFFYKDEEGKIQKFRICSSCLTGGFVKEDEGKKIFRISDRIMYCLACIKLHGIETDKVAKEEIIPEEPDEDSLKELDSSL